MKHEEIIDSTCEIIYEDNGRKMVAEVLSFSKNRSLTVSVERSLKLTLVWNGKIYEGNMGSKSFVSNGPDSRIVKRRR